MNLKKDPVTGKRPRWSISRPIFVSQIYGCARSPASAFAGLFRQKRMGGLWENAWSFLVFHFQSFIRIFVNFVMTRFPSREKNFTRPFCRFVAAPSKSGVWLPKWATGSHGEVGKGLDPSKLQSCDKTIWIKSPRPRSRRWKVRVRINRIKWNGKCQQNILFQMVFLILGAHDY